MNTLSVTAKERTKAWNVLVSLPWKVFSKPEQMLSGKTATGSSFRKSFRRLATESTSPSLTRSTFSP